MEIKFLFWTATIQFGQALPSLVVTLNHMSLLMILLFERSKEETGLTISHPQFVGVKQFYDKNHERYLVFFYVADEFKGTVKASDEGTLTWMTKEELQQHKLAYNFDHDLPVFFDPNVSEHMLDGKRDELFR